MAASPTIFQSSDLNRRGRSILDAARTGLARIRDTDGRSLVVTTEEAYEELRSRTETLRELTAAMTSFITIERAVDHEGRDPSMAELGHWTWVRHLPREDAGEFVRDVGDALYTSCQAGSAVALMTVLDEWKATAEALSDPLSRETLLAESSPEDYVEAKRPVGESPEDEALTAGRGSAVPAT